MQRVVGTEKTASARRTGLNFWLTSLANVMSVLAKRDRWFHVFEANWALQFDEDVEVQLLAGRFHDDIPSWRQQKILKSQMAKTMTCSMSCNVYGIWKHLLRYNACTIKVTTNVITVDLRFQALRISDTNFGFLR